MFEHRVGFVSPLDGLNLNQIAPGRRDGSISEILADVLLREVIGAAEYHIDLHAGDLEELLLPFAGYALTGRPTSTGWVRPSRAPTRRASFPSHSRRDDPALVPTALLPLTSHLLPLACCPVPFCSMIAHRATTFTESVIREMTRIANQHEAINLAQGFPDFPMPAPMKDAACAAIRGDINQYAITWGSPALRLAIAEKYRRWYGMEVDPDREITVTCGATEAMAATFLALVDPGDEVIILEPYYENYGPDAILADARPVFVPLEPPRWTLEPDRLRRAFGPRTKAIIVNTPHNPTGRVLSRDELSLIASLCIEHDAWAFTDEIYEHIRYTGTHHSLASWPGMRERTVTISGLSKTFSCTGWRLGYAIAPPPAANAIRKVHDFLTVGAPAPLQAAAAVGMAFDAAYYNHLVRDYQERRDIMTSALTEAGFRFSVPDGAYYVLADFSALSDMADEEFAKWMTRDVGVATVPGSSFYHDPALGSRLVRFAFCKKTATLEEAARRLASLPARV